MAGTDERVARAGIETVVVGFDGSDTARKAVLAAGRLSRSAGAALHVVHVIDDAQLRQGMVTEEAMTDNERQAVEANEAMQADSALADLDVTVTVLQGTPAVSIVKYATEAAADVIVVGNRRVQGLERLLGSVAVDILRRADCDVYVANTTL